MSETVVPTPLQAHTLDTLLGELVSGRPIVKDDGGEVFRLTGAEARAVLAWYRDRPDKWAKSVQAADIEAIVDQLDEPPPVLPPPQQADGSRAKRTLFLKSLRAHRFGGIHRFGAADEAPDEFCHTFERSLTLIEGANSSGKSSLLSAILWCLTGSIY